MEDLLWKELIYEFFKEFIEFFFPEIAADIDFTKTPVPLDKELQKIAPTAKTGLKIADLLFEIGLKNGQNSWLLLNIEVQGYRQETFAKRMFIYNYRIFDYYGKEVISLAVLTDRDRNYRPQRFGWQRWGFRHEMEFPLVKLLDWVEREGNLKEADNPFALVVWAWLKSGMSEVERYEERFKLILRLSRLLKQKGWDKEKVIRLLNFIEYMLKLPDELE